MRITTKDLIKINELKRQYKLEGTTDEIINEDLTRCENCGEICLKEEIEILTDWRNEKYKACEKCQEEHKEYLEKGWI